jgi:hypothetical protein
MTTDALTIDVARRSTSKDRSRAWTVALWLCQFAVAAILGLGAFVKFFDYVPEGSMDPAVALVVLAGALLALYGRRGELPLVGSR